MMIQVSRSTWKSKSQHDYERSRARLEILCAAVLGAAVAKPRRGSELHQRRIRDGLSQQRSGRTGVNLDVKLEMSRR